MQRLTTGSYCLVLGLTSIVWWTGGNDVDQFKAKLISVLKDKGPTNLSTLGGLVKRPAGIPKMKKFLEDNTAFKINGDSVSLV